MSDRKRKGAARAGKLPRAGGKHVAVVVGVVLCVKRVAKRGGVAKREEHLEEEEQLCEEEVEEPATHHRVSTAPYHPPNEDDSDLY